jgi:hypothetical protein
MVFSVRSVNEAALGHLANAIVTKKDVTAAGQVGRQGIVELKNVFWNVSPCGSCRNRHFGGMYCLHLQGENNELKHVRNS